MVARNWNRLWVAGTTLLISFISFSSQIFVIWPWYGRELSMDLLKLLGPFNCAVFMVFWNYRLVVTTSPGEVPDGWRPTMGALDGLEVKRGTHTPRYCKTCEHYKPPRAHHCRSCKTCWLKSSSPELFSLTTTALGLVIASASLTKVISFAFSFG
ncbi:palmitoyltransferase PFA4 [Cryptococcus floricola]|uniref:Palmitoyltransferase n=1 Tax=Cryptococcus floricola TaxID=2591691 RepID=A0A5D3B7H3_9TREE|nr:palmitoyltransferase PFA4 [Cryptococcus floricola]